MLSRILLSIHLEFKEFDADLEKYNNKKIELKTEEEAQHVLDNLLEDFTITDIEQEMFLFSVFFYVIVLLSAFVATPFQWHDVIMLLVISQIVMLKTYNQYYFAVTCDNIQTNL